MLPIFLMHLTEKIKTLGVGGIFCIMMIAYLIEQLGTSFITDFLSQFSVYNRFQNSISLYGIRCYDRYGCKNEKYATTATPGFVAVNHFLSRELRNGNIQNLKSLIEIMFSDHNAKPNFDLCFQMGNKCTVSIKNNKEWNDVFFQVSEEGIHRNLQKNHNVDEVTRIELKIMSNRVSTASLMKKCEKLYREYEDKKQGKTMNELFLCSYRGLEKDGTNVEYDIVPFQTNCSMENLYFEEKDKIMKYINFFQYNRDWYESRGRPYTLGICTHGLPGCGKTSFEKALAKHLKRHLIIIDFDKVKSEKELNQIFFSETIGPYRIPHEKRLYVFPDIDKTTDILYKEQFQHRDVLDAKFMQNILHTIQKKEELGGETKLLQEKTNPKISNINLSQILNIFDGLLERTGQIFIMSANHPEKLDPAIVRPGRIDCMVEFREFNLELLKKFIDRFFDQDSFLQQSFYAENSSELNYKFCPSRLFELCIQAEDTPSVLEKLLINTPASDD